MCFFQYFCVDFVATIEIVAFAFRVTGCKIKFVKFEKSCCCYALQTYDLQIFVGQTEKHKIITIWRQKQTWLKFHKLFCRSVTFIDYYIVFYGRGSVALHGGKIRKLYKGNHFSSNYSETVGPILMILSADPHENWMPMKCWKNQPSITSVRTDL